MRALWPLLASSLLLATSLAACVSDNGEYHTGPDAVERLSVLVRPSSPARAGDTLTFFAVFPDSTNERYRIQWDTDPRGKAIPSGCTRGVCTKWIVPNAGDRHQHSVQVSADRGISSVPFTTIVP